ncbi:MAG: hypothetical protein L6R40_008421 [Gallowayella cf. fulva]|nr:MAG: hypothetical protein L6R40_008421 [Xanthomendoza cf. fulva]
MFFVVFESTTPKSRAAVAGEYYVQMQKLLQSQPGFISEVPYASPIHDDQQVLIAKWTDEAGVLIWRNQHDHLQIQYKARNGVFDAYRLRVGPDLLPTESQAVQETDAVTKHKGQFIVLYEGPLTTSTRNVSDLVNPEKGSAATLAELVDASVYQSEKSVLWITSWPTQAAAVRFESAVQRTEGDVVPVFRVKRDYGGIDRSEAPRDADADQAASVEKGGKVA